LFLSKTALGLLVAGEEEEEEVVVVGFKVL
jgi:hypothetical protein